MKKHTRGITYITVLAMVCLCVSFSSSCKKQQESESAAAVATLTALATIKVAHDVYEYGRVQPHVESWRQDEIQVVGIKRSAIGEFFVWSVTDSKPLWWLVPSQQRIEDYSKKSKNERFSFTYGVVPKHWRQIIPVDGPPESPKDSTLLVFFNYSFPFMAGMRGESGKCYVKLFGQSAEILRASEISESSWISIQDHHKIWDLVNSTRVQLELSSTRHAKDSEQAVGGDSVKAADGLH
jgi:hypothetical protein